MINVIPMAGKGSRFFQEQYNVPKPFVPMMGNPMFITSVKSFPKAEKYIFICLREHFQKYMIKKAVEDNFPSSEIITLEKLTEGQASTCLLAEEKLNSREGLFIASCDYQMMYDNNKYQELLNSNDVDVIIWTFRTGNIRKADPSAFAYCKTQGNRVMEVVEKRTISNTPHLDPAVVGSFTFKRAELFIHGAKNMIKKNIRVNNEYYVGTSINQLIEENYRVVIFEIEKFISFGNPFELALFQYWEEFFDILEDHNYKIMY